MVSAAEVVGEDALLEAAEHDDHSDEEGDEHSDEEESEPEAAPASSTEEVEEHSDEGVYDPHLWFDPTLMAEVEQATGEAFAEADPDGADGYLENAERVATELGAEADLEAATDLARDLVARHGMSERLGLARLVARDSDLFLGGSAGLDRLSGLVHQELDLEVRRVLDGALATATGILKANRDLLDALAQRLLADETVEGPDLDAALSRVRAPEPGSNSRPYLKTVVVCMYGMAVRTSPRVTVHPRSLAVNREDRSTRTRFRLMLVTALAVGVMPLGAAAFAAPACNDPVANEIHELEEATGLEPLHDVEKAYCAAIGQ